MPTQQCPPVISTKHFQAVIFDMDGVITRTARLHARAWKAMFDEFLRRYTGPNFQPFNAEDDYLKYIDGIPRNDGVRNFLTARGIDLPWGSPDDIPGKETLYGLGNRKNQLFLQLLTEGGVEVYESTVALIQRLRASGLKTAVISSSKNCEHILASVGLLDMFDARVDGLEGERLHLKGKPAPDIFLEAAKRLHVEPRQAVVVEDAQLGVEAGRNGHFGLVVGVDRAGQSEALYRHGADCVVQDLAELPLEAPPDALQSFNKILARLDGHPAALFLDYDGTLTPIVDRPELAVLSQEMRSVLKRLGQRHTLAIVSGRGLQNVEERVGLPKLFYAGSHGFEIAGPGQHYEHPHAKGFLPALDQAEKSLKDALKDVSGVLVERKKYALAVHYRLSDPADVPKIKQQVEQAVQASQNKLKLQEGKMIFELKPAMEWHKGKALEWLMEGLDIHNAVPIYIGDDTTDEDAFRALRAHHINGIGIAVQETPHPTAASYTLSSPQAVQEFLERLTHA